MDNSKRKSIPIEHLSYDYIGSCSKKKELEDIVRCLRNGDEGFFPDLTKFAENKLRDVASNSSLLRESTRLIDKGEISAEYLKEIESSLSEWENEIKSADSILSKSSSTGINKLPPVRSASTIEPEVARKNPSDKSECTKTRIKRDDYKSWDSFDVDSAIIKMDVEEERLQEEAKKIRLQNEKKQKDLANQSINQSPSLQANTLEEAKYYSEKAREKGNEYFKEGDWPRAYACYSESHQLLPNPTAANNRALTLIKLGRYEEAVRDCTYVLQQEPSNIKALLRRSTALKSLPNHEYWRAALRDLESVISLEPNNKTAQNDYKVLRKQLNLPDNTSKVRLEIEEVPRERLPLTYYGPSTSSFRCERNSITHQMLAGPRMSCGEIVPCRCNRGAMAQNPICRHCGERQMRELRARANTGRPVPRSMCATYVVQEQMRKKLASTFNSKPMKVPQDSKQQESLKDVGQAVEEIGDQLSQVTIENKPEIAPTDRGDVQVASKADKVNGNVGNNETKASVIENNVNDNKMVEESRERLLASKAKERGVQSVAEYDYTKALGYFSTSLKLFHDNDTLLLRAGVYDKLNQYKDAIVDYNKILETEPRSLKALIGRISAIFKVVPRNYKLITEYVEEAYKLRPENSEIRLFRMLTTTEFLNNAREQMAVATVKEEMNAYARQNTANINTKPIDRVPATATDVAETNGHDYEPHSITNSSSSPRTPEERKRERNQKNRKRRKKGSITEPPSQENLRKTAQEPTKTATISNGIAHSKKKVADSSQVNNCKETEGLPSGFQFYSSWEACKKHDIEYKERLQLLRRVPPKQLATVVGEKLDAEMLSDLLHCLELMDKSKSAEYVSVLPNLQRFQTIKLFMDDDDSQRMDRIMKSIKG